MTAEARIQSLTEMLKLEPNDLFLNYSLGIEFAALNKLNEAETQYKKVLDFNEDYIAVYYQLGKLYEAKNSINEALIVYKLGLEKAKAQKNNKAINEINEAIFLIED